MYYDVGMYSGIWTRNFVYLVRWHGQLMSALAGHCLPTKKRRANKGQLGKHQLTTPSSNLNNISCLYSTISHYYHFQDNKTELIQWQNILNSKGFIREMIKTGNNALETHFYCVILSTGHSISWSLYLLSHSISWVTISWEPYST